MFVPESPRWLVKMGRNAEAKNFFVTYHANGIEDDELVLLEQWNRQLLLRPGASKRWHHYSFTASWHQRRSSDLQLVDGHFGFPLFVDKVGRRKLFLGSRIGMLVTLIAGSVCNERFLATGNKSAGYCMILFLFLFNGAYDFAYSPLPTLYTAEIHPFDLRAKGVSISFASAFGFGLFNQDVNPIALEAIT
ncbi:Lactose permease [Fusarium oxysporum f. sp. rapae]|uniref:Lactose permease n=1 Tax=Fusarium oxysporum f. sp. rapae TaxID=485398 RepID=A0A8J5NXG2_FUSOX|nr:Lactose permease [Fusarium oxysporum f. sp. rapae]